MFPEGNVVKFPVIRKFWRTFVLVSLPFQLLLIQLISNRPLWVENSYTKGFYTSLSIFLRKLFGSISVPVGQLLFYSIILFLVVWLGRQTWLVFTKRISVSYYFRHVGFTAVAFLSGFYFLFTLMWGLNYHRRPAQVLFQFSEKPMKGAELEQLCITLIRLTNQSRREISPNNQQALILPVSNAELIKQAPEGFKVLAATYPELRYTYPAVKQVYVPKLMSFFGIGGIYFPFTGEANVNMDPPVYLLPNTICHEMAHQIGFASEDEANFISYLVCRLHPNPVFRYSGNLMAMKYAMNRLKYTRPAAFTRLERSYSTGLKLDLEKNRAYWESFQNPLEIITDGIHDLFLKVNDQTEGLESYSRVVELLMGEYRKNGLNTTGLTE